MLRMIEEDGAIKHVCAIIIIIIISERKRRQMIRRDIPYYY